MDRLFTAGLPFATQREFVGVPTTYVDTEMLSPESGALVAHVFGTLRSRGVSVPSDRSGLSLDQEGDENKSTIGMSRGFR